jgi:Contractile injection system tube protein
MLEKLQILAYTDENFTQSAGQYSVQINPETYSQQFSAEYTGTPTLSTAGITNKFVTQKPQDLELMFFLDATGAVPQTSGGAPVTSVSDEIDKFKGIVYSYNGNIHSPNYLRVLWGKLKFDCRFVSMGIEYMLFSPSGVPLRAKLSPKFKQYLSSQKLALESKNSSPDLTHYRTVAAGDTLPLMCHRIYQDSKYYIDVAKVNGLTSFRDLEPGRQILFPPLGD